MGLEVLVGTGSVTVVIVTRNRAEDVLRTLDHLAALPERPPVIVVANASTDGTADAVLGAHPSVQVVSLDRNAGAAGRNVGVARAATPYVAFSDDDSWWAPGALALAASHLDAHPDVALLNGRILIGPGERLDETCLLMRDSPLPSRPGRPGPSILGFVACAAVVRRSAFLQAGGFAEPFGVGGEEDLLAIDLAAGGWDLVYVDDVVAHHHPSSSRDRDRRRSVVTRNQLWVTWLRRPAPVAWRHTAAALRRGRHDAAVRRGVQEAVRHGGWTLARRRVVPPDLEWRLSLLDEAEAG